MIITDLICLHIFAEHNNLIFNFSGKMMVIYDLESAAYSNPGFLTMVAVDPLNTKGYYEVIRQLVCNDKNNIKND